MTIFNLIRRRSIPSILCELQGKAEAGFRSADASQEKMEVERRREALPHMPSCRILQVAHIQSNTRGFPDIHIVTRGLKGARIFPRGDILLFLRGAQCKYTVHAYPIRS